MRFCLILLLTLSSSAVGLVAWAHDRIAAAGEWKRNAAAAQRFTIQGTGDRNNPLRRPLSEPFSGDELFVRFRIRYDARSIDTPDTGDGEFFVLWLDEVEGSDSSTHSSGVPNIGVHVEGNSNRFMVRYRSTAQQFGPVLEGDREYLVVARLSRTATGEQRPLDRLEIWVNPAANQKSPPAAVTSGKSAVSQVKWIGFSTGRKTEVSDRIDVWDVALAGTWEQILGLPIPTTPEPQPPPKVTVAFADDVLPILQSRCFDCHSGNDAEEGVRLDVLDEVLNRTSPGNASNSRLIELVKAGKMPPDEAPIPQEEVAVLSAWINEGLDWDHQLLPTPIPQTEHWSFQPVYRPPVPKIERANWIRTPVDAFIGRRHEQLGIAPAPPADEATFRRRVTLDLLGLPPSEIGSLEVEGIDKLLLSRAHGERWGRHWLDVARWAESNGYQHNRMRPQAWRYRDWVVDAITSGKPYDAFLREQLAGDELTPYDDANLIATGFLAAARYSGNELDKEIQRNDLLVDVANTTAKAFLGLTLECAQCHTHKFDPLSVRDYYRFQAFFLPGQPGNVILRQQDDDANDLIRQRWELFDSVHARLVAAKRAKGHPEPVYVIPKSVIAGMRADEKKQFTELEQRIGKLAQTWSFYSPVTSEHRLIVAPHEMRWPLPRDASLLASLTPRLLIRGDVKSPGPTVAAGWPAVFGSPPDDFEPTRTALAHWMTSPDHPLTARVWVNRIWQWHFGKGLVETSGDFGTQGLPPTHPALLDYLASELIDSGWDTRHVHRLIVNSATYRQSSRFSATNAAIDPDNQSYWRWTPRRLEAEAIRDCVLAVSGQLDDKAGGPSVPSDSNRRSLYLTQQRDKLPHQQMLFDSAAGITSCSRRRVSTTSLQPLWLLNSRFMQIAAERFAQRVDSVEQAISMAYGRRATDEEIDTLESLADEYGLESACLAILNSSEFVYIP